MNAEYIKKTKYENQLPPPPFAPKLVDYNLKLDGLLSAGALSGVFLESEIDPEVDLELGAPVDFLASAEDFFADSEHRLAAMALDNPDGRPQTLDEEDMELLGDPEPSGVLATASSGARAVTAAQASAAGLQPPTSADGGSGNTSGVVAAGNLSGNSTIGSSGAPLSGGDEEHHSSEIGAGTSFLRRTAYMTSETRRASKRKAAAGSRSQENSRERLEREVARIEQTFADARAPLEGLRHPKRPHLHAVSAQPLLPDAKVSDLQFFEVRLLGSASLESHAREQRESGHSGAAPTMTQLHASLFLHQKLPADIGGDNVSDWLSLYVPENDKDAEDFARRRLELRDTLSATEMQEQEDTVWSLGRVLDADLTLMRPQTRFEEIVISAGEGGDCYYIPIAARANLRRRRVAPRVQEELRALKLDVDELEVGLKELTTSESIERDEVRSIYDPVRFG